MAVTRGRWGQRRTGAQRHHLIRRRGRYPARTRTRAAPNHG